jgi:hypothetical protein
MRTFHCRDRGFEYRWGHECSCLVFVVFRVGSCLCDEPITHSEESYRRRVFAFLILCHLETSTTGGLRPSCAVGPLEKTVHKYLPTYLPSHLPAYVTKSFTKESIWGTNSFAVIKNTALHETQLLNTWFAKPDTSPYTQPQNSNPRFQIQLLWHKF